MLHKTGSFVETITPERAKELLFTKSNRHNRRLKRRHVKKLAAMMVAGRWCLNGEPIIIASDGTLLDGQHRLTACVEAGVPFQTYVVYGVDLGVFPTMGRHAGRTVGDVLGIDDCKSPNSVGAAIRWVEVVRRGTPYGATEIEPYEAREWRQKDARIESSVLKVSAVKKLMPLGMAGALHYLFAGRDEVSADQFFEDLAFGLNLPAGDPVAPLRDRLLRNKVQKAVLKNEEIFALCIRAWNRRRDGFETKTLKGLIRHRDGTTAMPEIK
jgi:hypothetical protein